MKEKLPWVLLIEENSRTREFLRSSLQSKGYDVISTGDGRQALDLLGNQERSPGAVIMEVLLPGLDGFDLLDRIRETSSVPVIFLSSQTDERTKVAAFEKGADDFVTKPFGLEEFCARLRSVLRRTGRLGSAYALEPMMSFGELTVNFHLREVRVKNELIKLTPTEYDLLKIMIEHADKVLTHQMLLSQVWGDEYTSRVQYLRVYMGQLRKKLERGGTHRTFIVTDPGVGYRFNGESS